MKIVNFSHPLTEAQISQLTLLTGEPVGEIYDVPCQFDNSHSFADQVAEQVEKVGLSPSQWQTARILINPPSYAPAASTLIAELHGRMGYFPAIIRIRPVNGSMPPQFEVAEIINLQALRDKSRERRQ